MNGDLIFVMALLTALVLQMGIFVTYLPRWRRGEPPPRGWLPAIVACWAATMVILAARACFS